MRQTSTTGILPRKYKSGSIIYFEGDKSEYIYILKTGRVLLTSVKLDSGEEVKEDVRQGEFFGVKSSLGRYPREETAQVIGDTEVLIMNPSDFERLILRNVNVVLKMLRVFSNQLRRIHKSVRSVLGDETEIKPELELFKIGEYYFKGGSLSHARYAFKKYLEYYPDQQYAKAAMDRIKAIDSGQVSPEDMDFGTPSPAPASRSVIDDDGFSFDEPEAPGPQGDAGRGDGKRSRIDGGDDLTPVSSEMDDFLSGDGGGSGLDDFSLDNFEEPGGGPSVADDYARAKGLMKSGKFAEAAAKMAEITSGAEPAGIEDRRAYESAHGDLGTCYVKAGRLKEALDTYSGMIKKFPGTPLEKAAYFYIGTIFESANKPDKAISYFNRVLNMTPKDDLNTQAMKKIRELQSR
ncbi:MAG: cyclic nucleotide-binding domain-containing protein [Spirochaetes bacterium]|nr:cyclic nucleotide-binding domain-containing protein [Spirochaetota bacterium]